MDYELTTEQQEAENKIYDWFTGSSDQTFVLAGYAGTGKTTLLRHTVKERLKLEDGVSAAFIAPTGKAATVLIKKGINASTLHHLIYQPVLEQHDVVIKGKVVTVERVTFHRREEIDSKIKLIVLDEYSMVSDTMLEDVLNFGVKVLLCGDSAQLPPVEGANTFIGRPNYMLTSIVRQQSNNPIISLSERARRGANIGIGNYGPNVRVCSVSRLNAAERREILLWADQIICGTNRTRTSINDEIRKYKGFTAPVPEIGEKLICTQNDWGQSLDREQRYGLVNGIIGTVVSVEHDELEHIGYMKFRAEFADEPCENEIAFDTGIFTTTDYFHKRGAYFQKVDKRGKEVGEPFPIERFEYGYCISCHKAQGSEFDKLVVFDESRIFRQDAARWLYTAITRAKKELIILR